VELYFLHGLVGICVLVNQSYGCLAWRGNHNYPVHIKSTSIWTYNWTYIYIYYQDVRNHEYQILINFHLYRAVAYPGILFGRGGGPTNSVEDRRQRERGPGGGSPLVTCSLNLQLSETRILIMLYGCIFHGTGNSAQLCQNFGILGEWGLNPSTPSVNQEIEIKHIEASDIDSAS
jgi:hypothetical protein